MAAGLLLTLTLEDTAEGSSEEKLAVDGFVAGLVADLNGIEPGSATTLLAEEAEPGSKALGALLLGALAAEGLLNPAPIRRAWGEHLAGSANLQYPLWTVLMLQAWREEQRAPTREA